MRKFSSGLVIGQSIIMTIIIIIIVVDIIIIIIIYFILLLLFFHYVHLRVRYHVLNTNYLKCQQMGSPV